MNRRAMELMHERPQALSPDAKALRAVADQQYADARRILGDFDGPELRSLQTACARLADLCEERYDLLPARLRDEHEYGECGS